VVRVESIMSGKSDPTTTVATGDQETATTSDATAPKTSTSSESKGGAKKPPPINKAKEPRQADPVDSMTSWTLI